MVHCIVTLRLFVPFEKREVDDPQWFIHVRVAQAELVTHLKTESVHLYSRWHGFAAENQQHITWFGVAFVEPSLQNLRCVELINRRLDCAVFVVFHVNEAFGTNLRTFYKVGECVSLLAGVVGAAFSVDGDHEFSLVEHREAVTFRHVVELDKLHSETDIRLVRAVIFHCVLPSNSWKIAEFYTFDGLEQMFCQALEHVDDIFLFDERHLAVDLSELRLTVGAEVLIAEAAHNLEVAVETGHHKKLLELLR